MTTTEWITAPLVFIIAAILAVVSIRSFQNKGFLFNNAFIIYAIVSTVQLLRNCEKRTR